MMSLPQAAVHLAIALLLQLLFLSSTSAVLPLTDDREEAREIAREAYLLLTPAVLNWRFFAVSSRRNGFDNFRHFRIAIPPNNNVIYSVAWLNLRQDARVVTVPQIAGRYYSLHIIDGYTHNLRIASERTIGNGGGTFVVTRSREGECSIPPTEECPPLVGDVVCSAGDFVLLLVRIQFLSQFDRRFVVPTIQARFGITELDVFCGGPGIIPIAAPDPFLIMSDLETLDFFRYANLILLTLDVAENETDDFERFSRIGIGAGEPFPPPQLSQDILNYIQLGIENASSEIDAEIQAFAEGVQSDGWQVLVQPPQYGSRVQMQDRFLTRAGAARGGLYGLDPEEAMYEFARKSATGETLDASNGQAYHILFREDQVPPVSGFDPSKPDDLIGYWSLTMHRASNNMFVVNRLRRHSLGSRDLDSICRYPNDSFPIIMQSEQPNFNLLSNWLPAPAAEFFLVMRLYVPTQDALRKPYLPPGVKPGLPSEIPTDCGERFTFG